MEAGSGHVYILSGGNENTTRAVLLAFSLLATALGNSLQCVSILTWLQPAALLLVYDTFCFGPLTLQSVAKHLGIALLHAAASAFAFRGALSANGPESWQGELTARR